MHAHTNTQNWKSPIYNIDDSHFFDGLYNVASNRLQCVIYLHLCIVCLCVWMPLRPLCMPVCVSSLVFSDVHNSHTFVLCTAHLSSFVFICISLCASSE